MKINYRKKQVTQVLDEDYADWKDGDQVMFIQYEPGSGDKETINRYGMKNGDIYNIEYDNGYGVQKYQDGKYNIFLDEIDVGLTANKQFKRVKTNYI